LGLARRRLVSAGSRLTDPASNSSIIHPPLFWRITLETLCSYHFAACRCGCRRRLFST
jgi:hypothetical protein